MTSLLDDVIMELAPTFPEMFSMFCSEHLESFRGAPRNTEGMEHRLEWHAAYESYLKMFESALEDFLRSRGATPMEFYEQAQKAQDASSEHKFFIDILLSCTEYERFYDMMVAECALQEHTARVEAAQSKHSGK
jgi:hypothetical protein